MYIRVVWRAEPVGDAGLFAVTVENRTPVDRVVTVENTLGGRVLPPRVDGVPAPDYRAERDLYRGRVSAGERVSVGFAVVGTSSIPDSDQRGSCRVPCRGRAPDCGDAPVVVADAGRPDGTDTGVDATGAANRWLPTHRPARDAVPLPSVGVDTGASGSEPTPRGRRNERTSGPDAVPASGWEWQTADRLADPDRRDGGGHAAGRPSAPGGRS
jgi:hypothetical protein